MEYVNKVPFNRAVRVGNFKLWRSSVKVKTSDGKMVSECLSISTLVGEWLVRVPDTWEMFGQLCSAYGDTLSDDKEKRAVGEAIVTNVCSNMLYVSSTANGYYLQGVKMLTAAFYNPDILREKKKRRTLEQDVKSLIEQFLVWRKQYDEAIEKLQPTEEDDHREEMADKAFEIMKEGEV